MHRTPLGREPWREPWRCASSASAAAAPRTCTTRAYSGLAAGSTGELNHCCAGWVPISRRSTWGTGSVGGLGARRGRAQGARAPPPRRAAAQGAHPAPPPIPPPHLVHHVLYGCVHRAPKRATATPRACARANPAARLLPLPSAHCRHHMTLCAAGLGGAGGAEHARELRVVGAAMHTPARPPALDGGALREAGEFTGAARTAPVERHRPAAAACVGRRAVHVLPPICAPTHSHSSPVGVPEGRQAGEGGVSRSDRERLR